MSKKAPTSAGRVVAITGGSGFIGGHLLDALIADDTVSRIYVMDIAPTTRWCEKVTFVYTNLARDVQFEPKQKIDVVYHLAAVSREPGFEWNEYFDINYEGTRRLLKWVSKLDIKNIVFTSTGMVFKAGPFHRAPSEVPSADTAYGISKALAEEAMSGWQQSKRGRHVAVVRPGAVFGKGCGGNFVNLHRALRLGTFAYIGGPETVKSCIYVKDLVALMRGAAELKGWHVLHGTYPQAPTIGEICNAFCKVFGWTRVIPTVPLNLALRAAAPLQMLNELGFSNPVHKRRVEKLHYSTDIDGSGLLELDLAPTHSLVEAIQDWRDECAPADPH